MAHTVKTCLHGSDMDTCKQCPQPLTDNQIGSNEQYIDNSYTYLLGYVQMWNIQRHE